MIEAFDQPWKRDLEGTVGGYWGVFSGDREQKFPLTGPVSNYPDWQSDWPILLCIGAVLLAVTVMPRRDDLSAPRAVLLPILAAGAAGLLILYARRIGVVAFLWHEIAVEVFLWLIAGLTAVVALSALAAKQGDTERASVAALLAGHVDFKQRGNWLALLQLLSVLGATVVSLGLAFDARYRDFPSLAFAIPALAHALLMLTRRDRAIDMRRGDRREETILSLILVAASLAIPVIEGPQNIRALIWTGEALLIALPWLRYWPSFFRSRSTQVSAVSV
jgi:glucan 1,3-beta-glucosidase